MNDLNPPALEDAGKCPKCGYTRDPSWTECPACGVIFARLRSADTPPPPPVPVEDGLFNPYEAPRADIYESGPALRGELELADPGSRLVAELINGFSLVIMMGLGVLPFLTIGRGETPGCGHFALILIMVMVWISWNWSWIAKYDQSVGKRMMGIRVVRSGGERATMGQQIGMRWLVGKFLLRIIPFYELIDALFVFRADRRCVHDHVADTIVVKTPPGWQGESF